MKTTKSDTIFHGIGIKSVKHILEAYDGEFSLVFEDGMATAIATILIS